MKRTLFRERYGPWAVIAGAAEGLGAAFARAVAQRGLDVVLADRQIGAATALAAALEGEHRVATRVVELDLGAEDAARRIAAATADVDVGLAVYDAAHAHVGPWTEQPLADQLRVVDVNVRGLLRVAQLLVPPMAARGRGGLVVVSSNAGLAGHALTATYGASKAFGVVLAEALWHELRPRGVDVLASCPAAIATPGFSASGARLPQSFVLSPSRVAEQSLEALGRGPVVHVGGGSHLTAALLRFLPRGATVALLGRAMHAVYPPRG